ncbi:alpha/beta fold hydrolase [Cellulophaga sp. F20128]|uniref:alpha/beta hydrolase family protein n=1 Tax=Cellulophaga sp. F20128 TaxID=2926413 RepID=UPI001FF5B6B3|nr:alpha/beta fold hydrolase [Cellulophaga sp. F20128]MCK0156401.1 alpha/beta fold hydrolase [Cellulophaga sp. F20128]
MRIGSRKIKINTTKGHTITATEFSSVKGNGETILISSATGVLQKYYYKFATFFATKGYTVYTFDYNGIGSSGGHIKQVRKNTSTLKEWGSIDQAAITLYAKQKNPLHKLTVITHSIGGQIVGFNGNYKMIDKLVLVASQSGYWNLFGGIHKLKMLLFWSAVLPIATKIFGYFPAKKMGLFENLPKNMAYEWARWGRKKNYFMHYHSEASHFFSNLNIPILSYSFPKDNFAPKEAVDWLTTQFNSAKTKRVHYIPAAADLAKLKHFGFFRPHFKNSLWKTTDEWIRTN